MAASILAIAFTAAKFASLLPSFWTVATHDDGPAHFSAGVRRKR
ncbi:hypothetical protein AAGW05_04170 [Arthrobacter sp. LAPM80]